MSIPYCQSIILPGLNLEKVYDWAGIEGLWHCSFASLTIANFYVSTFLIQYHPSTCAEFNNYGIGVTPS